MPGRDADTRRWECPTNPEHHYRDAIGIEDQANCSQTFVGTRREDNISLMLCDCNGHWGFTNVLGTLTTTNLLQSQDVKIQPEAAEGINCRVCLGCSKLQTATNSNMRHQVKPAHLQLYWPRPGYPDGATVKAGCHHYDQSPNAESLHQFAGVLSDCQVKTGPNIALTLGHPHHPKGQWAWVDHP